MPYADEFGPGGEGASPARQRIDELERKRLDVGASYLELSLLGTVLFQVGRGYIFLAEVALLVAMLAFAGLAAIGGPTGLAVLGVLVAMIAGAVLSLYARASLAGWVEEHNARLDDEIAEVAREVGNSELR